MNSCGKMSATPAVSGCRLRLSNFFLEEILRFAEQILGFLRWHTPKILRSSRHPLPAPCLTFFKRNQVYLLIPFSVLLLCNTQSGRVVLCNPSFCGVFVLTGLLVVEEADSVETHYHVITICCFDNQVISNGTAWLSNNGYTGFFGAVYVVAEWEEGVGT